MATLQSVTGLARLYLDDIDADVFDDATLLGHVNSAYRLLQQVHAVNSAASTRKTATAEVLTGESTPDVLEVPDDLWLPFQLWEKAAGTTDDYYSLMDGPRALPNTTGDERLRFWQYENGLIGFVPATRDNTIKIHYTRTLPPLTVPSSVIQIPYAEDYLAWMTTAYAARVRGSADYANDCVRFAQAHLEAMLKGAVMANQYRSYRARAYGTRR